MQTNMEGKVEVFDLDNGFILTFASVPKGYRQTEFKLEGALSEKLGRLNNFNRIKSLGPWKENGKYNLFEEFKNALKERGWDFQKFPNPVAYLSYYDFNKGT